MLYMCKSHKIVSLSFKFIFYGRMADGFLLLITIFSIIDSGTRKCIYCIKSYYFSENTVEYFDVVSNTIQSKNYRFNLSKFIYYI